MVAKRTFRKVLQKFPEGFPKKVDPKFDTAGTPYSLSVSPWDGGRRLASGKQWRRIFLRPQLSTTFFEKKASGRIFIFSNRNVYDHNFMFQGVQARVHRPELKTPVIKDAWISRNVIKNHRFRCVTPPPKRWSKASERSRHESILLKWTRA